MNWICLDCQQVGNLTRHGRCSTCNSNAVAWEGVMYRVLLSLDEHGKYLFERQWCTATNGWTTIFKHKLESLDPHQFCMPLWVSNFLAQTKKEPVQ